MATNQGGSMTPGTHADLVARLRDEADNLARYTRRAINAQMRRLAREGEGETR